MSMDVASASAGTTPGGITPWTLPAAFSAMQPYSQWFIYRLYGRDENGKYKKQPIEPRTRKLPVKDQGGIHMCADWQTVAQVVAELQSAAQAAELYVPGFYLTAADPFWFLDIDQCVVQDAHNQLAWSPLAIELLKAFPEAAKEQSSSGKGWHIIGTGTAPEHRCKNGRDNLEFYTEGRGIALTCQHASGNAAADHSETLLPWLVKRFFQVEPANNSDAGWSTHPRADWHGPDDDATLITIAKRSRNPQAVFGGKASFKELWTANKDKLATVFPSPRGDDWDRSSADQALADHLAFYTGCNAERIQKLMQESALTRGKWHDRPEYLRATIRKACTATKHCYNDGKGVVAGAPAPQTNAETTGISLEDFHAFLPQHAYIFVPTRDLWPAASVNASVMLWREGIKPSAWLDRARPVHQMTWAPGQPMVISDRLVADGGWIHGEGRNAFNLYRAPTVQPVDPSKAVPWIDLIKFVYPNDTEHIVKWLAHRRQYPGEKINHALVFGGGPGIGKDTIMEPLKRAVGPWNFKEIAPKDLLADFNPHVKSVVLRVSEARDSGDMSRYALYEHCKTLLASPPDVLRCNEKNLREHAVFNVVGVIFTTNHRDGLYLPADDRRHFVAWSEREQSDFREGYWAAIYEWYEAGGFGHVAAYLDAVDLSGFNPKEPPPKTPAFWAMVDAGRAPEDGDLADALDKLSNPPAVTLGQIQAVANPEFQHWLQSNRRHIRHRFEKLGYEVVLNDADKRDGQWKVNGKRQTIYGRKELSAHDRFAAAAALRKGIESA